MSWHLVSLQCVKSRTFSLCLSLVSSRPKPECLGSSHVSIPLSWPMSLSQKKCLDSITGINRRDALPGNGYVTQSGAIIRPWGTRTLKITRTLTLTPTLHIITVTLWARTEKSKRSIQISVPGRIITFSLCASTLWRQSGIPSCAARSGNFFGAKFEFRMAFQFLEQVPESMTDTPQRFPFLV